MRTREPATAPARDPVDRRRGKVEGGLLRGKIAAYARNVARSSDDLDPRLEAAGVEHLLRALPAPLLDHVGEELKTAQDLR